MCDSIILWIYCKINSLKNLRYLYILFYFNFKNPEAYNETMQTAWTMHDMPKDGAKIQSLLKFSMHSSGSSSLSNKYKWNNYEV